MRCWEIRVNMFEIVTKLNNASFFWKIFTPIKNIDNIYNFLQQGYSNNGYQFRTRSRNCDNIK